MSLISKPYTFSSGATIIAAEHNSNFDTLYSDYNGNITNANVASNAAIAYAKLNLANGITSSDINSLTVFALANIPTGTTANKVLALDSSAKIPAVDGSQLTNITQANLSSILDYATSTTTGTSKAQTALKIAYGTITVGGLSTQAITNLLFTSSTSYSVSVTGTTGDFNENFSVSNGSGSSTTVRNNHNDSRTAYWIAIGT